MTIEELFGTLQMSVVGGWRKHLRAAKYGKHMALDEFYKEMPEKVDDLIEAWMGAHGKKIGSFTNILSSSNMNTLKYLGELKKVCKNGYELMGDNDELKSLLDDIVNFINSTLYKVKELSESRMKNLTDFINEAVNVEYTPMYELEYDIFNVLSDLAYTYESKNKSRLFSKANVKKAFNNFLDKFYEDIDESRVNESASSSDINKATKLIGRMCNDDDLISVSSCFQWLDECDWKEMNENGYAKLINGINDDVEVEYAKEYYAPVMKAMAKVGKKESIEILKRLGVTDEELEDFVTESVVNEAKTEVMFVLDHDSPNYLYCVNSGDLDKVSAIVDEYDYYSEYHTSNTKLATIEWNDESIYVTPIEGNNLAAAKKKDLANIQAQLDKQKEDIEKDGYVYIESDIFGGAGEWSDAKPTDKAKKYLDKFIGMMNDSYVDGDSNSARSLVDLAGGKTLIGNEGIVFLSADEFLSQFEEE